MFKKARIKLTVYYLAVIMVILLTFSYLSYRGFVFEMRRGLRQRVLQKVGDIYNVPPPLGVFISPRVVYEKLETEIFEDARRRMMLNLLFINLGVLFVSGVGGYFLAGKTLEPIEKIVDGQKRFVSDASHELRTPLTILKTQIEVALKEKLTVLGARKLLRSNLEEVDRMQKLSNYLLSLSFYERSELKTQRMDLSKIAVLEIAKLRPLAASKKIKIQTKLQKVVIKGNIMAISELIKVLVENAIKYSNSGGKIVIKLVKTGRHKLIEVEDFGVGIKATDLPHIFDRFYQAESSRAKADGNSYGLGLSIAKQIADLHHAAIKVESKYGKGSIFRVVFS